MNLAFCAAIPILCSIFLCFPAVYTSRYRNLLTECFVILTSICVFISILGNDVSSFLLFRLNEEFVCAFRVSGSGKLFIGLSAFLWPLSALYSFEYMKHSVRNGYFYTFYILAYAAAILIAASANLFTLYIFYECLTIVTLPLVEHDHNKASFRAGRSYLIYLMGGASLSFASMIILSVMRDPGITVQRITYLLMFLGFGAKAAVFPLCFWLPRASVAPTPVTALLHAVAVVNAGVYSVYRGSEFFSSAVITGSWCQYVVLSLTAFTVVYGAVNAVREKHLKRRLAWSTVSNLNYMLFALALFSKDGTTAAFAHMIFHGLIKIVLFFCAGAILTQTGYTQIQQTRGLAKRMPKTFFCFVLSGAALAGIPPLAGFTGKYLIITASLKADGLLPIVGCCCLIISAILTAIYIFPVLIGAYFSPCSDDSLCDPGKGMLLSMFVICAAILAISFLSDPAIKLIEGMI